MRKAITMLLILSIIFTLPASALAAETPAARFADWDDEAWYAQAMEYCVGQNIFQGTDEGRLEAGRTITRAELIAVITRLLGMYKQADISAFEDVSAGDWYYEHVARGVQMGVTNGTSETTFSPNEPVSREQAMTVLRRILALPGGAMSDLSQFSDAADTSAWAVSSVAAVVKDGRAAGYPDGTLRPRAELTRAEIAQLIFNTFQAISSETRLSGVETDKVYLIRADAQDVLVEECDFDDTLIIAPSVADYRVDIRNSSIKKLLCWGAGDVYVDKNSAVQNVQLPRTDGHVTVHWANGNYATLDPMNGEAAFTVEIRRNGTIPVPADPVKEGFVFAGWYTDEHGGDIFDFTGDAAQDGLAPYARWYTPREWAEFQRLNALASSMTVSVYADTDLMADAGADSIPCLIQSGERNEGKILAGLYLDDGSKLGEITLSPGERVLEMPVDGELPPAGTYAVRFVITHENGSGASFEIEGALYVTALPDGGEAA